MTAHSRRPRFAAGATLAALALTLASCSISAEDSTDKGTTSKGTLTSATASASAGDAAQTSGNVTLSKSYVKAKDASKNMTAIFGTLANNGDAALHLTSVTSTDPKLSGMLELHVVENGTMKEALEGFTIPAHGSLTMQPGAEHIMIMNNTQDLKVGDEATITLHFENADDATFTVPILVQASGEENYGGSADASATTSMSMSH